MKRAIELALGPLLLGFAATALGSSALLAVAIGLAIVYAGSAQVVAVAQRRVRVTRSLQSQEVIEGQPTELRYDVVGLGNLPAGLERLCSCGQWHRVEPGDAAATTIGVPGRYRVDASGLRLRDDLGLLSRPVEAADPIELLVLPAPLARRRDRRAAQQAQTGDPEPDGLREYQPGTPVSRIHWKSLAGGGPLQERQFLHTADDLPLLVVDTTGANPEQLAWAARSAAGEILALAGSGGCRVLLPGDRLPTPVTDPHAGWAPLHRRLAELESGAPDPAPGVELSRATVIAAARAPADELTPLPPLPAGVSAVAPPSAAAPPWIGAAPPAARVEHAA